MRNHHSLANVLAFLALSLLVTATRPSQAQSRQTFLPADESLEQIELEPGFQARLLAHEPATIDPVDVAFDDAGRMWVVEMRDYPFRVSDTPGGRIRVLQDLDHDGRFESASLFADRLEMPTGLALWKDGVVVTLAGQLVFLRDLDGDLVADETQVWLTGFSEDNEQLRANHPRLGLDGSWTIASGLRGGKVQLGDALASEKSAEPLNIGSRDVRFHPATAKLELITGPAQFGLCFDVVGNRYFCSNRNPAVQAIFEQEDLAGNPLAGILPSVVDVVPAGEESRVFPLVDAWTTSNLHSGQFTAACGVFVRSHAAAGTDELRNEIFTCEPTGSLVKRCLSSVSSYAPELLHSASEPPREWLASRDAWFRPVNTAFAPDGEMVIVDMHRAVIEHPQWVPEELKHRPDERWGDTAGRIFWVGQAGNDRLGEVLADLQDRPLRLRSDGELVALVASGNPWLRETASRLLVERASRVASELARQVNNEQLPLLGRVASLRLALQLPSDPPIDVATIVKPDSPTALQLAALRGLRDSKHLLPLHQEFLTGLLALDNESVRFEALLCLGQISTEQPQPLPEARVAALPADQPYVLVAAASAMRSQPARLLGTWLKRLNSQSKAETHKHTATIARGLATAVLAQNPDSELFAELANANFLEAPHNASVAGLAALGVFASKYSDRLDDDLWQRIVATVENTSQPEVRDQAIELLSHSVRPADGERLAEMARSEMEPTFKATLLTAWSRRGGAAFDRYLSESLAASSPAMMVNLLKLIGQRPERVAQLASQIRDGKISPRQIGAGELKKLVTRAEGESKAFLQEQLDGLVNSNRTKVLEQYKSCLELAGDPSRGKLVFKTQCASCHRIADIGVQVGPDISDSRTQQPLQLLTSILNPNLAIDNNYFRFVVLTEDDEIIEGIVAEETSDAIVLRGQDDKRTVIPRSRIVDFKATGVSLMPEGVEAQIDHQSMADLIAFIKGWRYMDGAVPGK